MHIRFDNGLAQNRRLVIITTNDVPVHWHMMSLGIKKLMLTRSVRYSLQWRHNELNGVLNHQPQLFTCIYLSTIELKLSHVIKKVTQYVWHAHPLPI